MAGRRQTAPGRGKVATLLRTNPVDVVFHQTGWQPWSLRLLVDSRPELQEHRDTRTTGRHTAVLRLLLDGETLRGAARKGRVATKTVERISAPLRRQIVAARRWWKCLGDYRCRLLIVRPGVDECVATFAANRASVAAVIRAVDAADVQFIDQLLDTVR
ncbi:hypothetical protein [Saccharopolyspora shandongensis]|uniref:hypothetical protein n=1 Tax=Saccharopolyspora shandongensis TaxID=418495 RepID=UPI0033DBA11B